MDSNTNQLPSDPPEELTSNLSQASSSSESIVQKLNTLCPIEGTEEMKNDALWHRMTRKNGMTEKTHFEKFINNGDYMRCRCCKAIFLFSNKKARYRNTPFRNHLTSSCPNPPKDFSRRVFDIMELKKLCVQKVNKKLRKVVIKTDVSPLELVAGITTKLKLPPSVLEKIKVDLRYMSKISPRHITESGKTLNPANLRISLSDTANNIVDFWRREFESSRYVLERPSITTPQTFKTSLTRRLAELSLVTTVSVVLDHWSDRKMNNYLGIMITVFNRSKESMESFLLGLPRTTSHTSEGILEDFAKVMGKYPGISELIVSVASDNASNMLKFSRLLGESDQIGVRFLGRVPCMLHSTNLMNGCILNSTDNHSLGNDAYVEMPTDKNQIPKCALNFEVVEKVTTAGQRSPMPLERTPRTQNISGGSSHDSGQEKTGSDILKSINELHKEISQSSTKKKTYEETCRKHDLCYQNQPYTLKTFSITRWVSGVDVILRMLLLRPALEDLASSGIFKVNFYSDDFERAKEILELLSPFRNFCEVFSNSTCTVKFALPFLIRYDKEMGEKTRAHNERPTPGKKTGLLLVDFQRRMEKYYQLYLKSSIHIMASYLFVGFATNQFWTILVKNRREGYRVKQIHQNLAERYASLLIPYLNMSFSEPGMASEVPSSQFDDTFGNSADGSVFDIDSSNHQMDEEPVGSGTTDGNTLGSYFERDSIKSNLKAMIVKELDTYRRLVQSDSKRCCQEFVAEQGTPNGDKLLQKFQISIGIDKVFWRSNGHIFPLLSFVNSIFQNIPATSIDVERVFSEASARKRPTSERLSEEKFEESCILKSFANSIEFNHINLETCFLQQALAVTEELRD